MGFRNIGKALAQLRQQRGLSQAQVADRSGIGRPQLSRYESGKELMKLDTLEKILRTLTIEHDDFFRFLRSLDDSDNPPQVRVGDRVDDRMLADAFQNLHRAVDGLRQVVERAVDPYTRFMAFQNLHTAIDGVRQVVERAIDPAVRFARLIEEAAAWSRGTRQNGAVGHGSENEVAEPPRQAAPAALAATSGAKTMPEGGLHQRRQP
jgi:transcriptional regulator with XRE-family HTH domain